MDINESALCSRDTELFTQKNLCAGLNEVSNRNDLVTCGSSAKVKFNGYLLRRNDNVKYYTLIVQRYK